VVAARLQDGGCPICTRLQDGGGSALWGRSVVSGGRAFLASPWSSPAVDGDGG
jgi:hypothetical protein